MIKLQTLLVAVVATTVLFQASAAHNSATPHIIRLRSGLHIEYAVTGRYDTSSTPIIAIHGLGDAWWSFYLLMQQLPDLRIYSLSLPCFGDSTKDTGVIGDIDRLGQTLVEFMDAMGLDKAYLMGHSMGSLFAPYIVSTHPDRFAGLILLGSRASVANDPSIVSTDPNVGLVGWIYQSFADLGLGEDDTPPESFCNDWQSSTTYFSPHRDPIPSWFFDGCVHESMKVPVKCWKAAVNAMSVDHSAVLSQLTKPALMVMGDHDIFPFEGAPGGPDALLMNIQANPPFFFNKIWEAGHATHWETPQIVAVMVRYFIKASEYGINHVDEYIIN